MIETTKGNLLKAPAEALVNTVNTVGVMGKGIALQFRQAFPEMYREYEKACERGEVQLGRVQVFDLGGLAGQGGEHRADRAAPPLVDDRRTGAASQDV